LSSTFEGAARSRVHLSESAFFGNRTDLHRVPRYNMHTLLRTNYCDTCSLMTATSSTPVSATTKPWAWARGLGLRLQLALLVLLETARTPTLLTRKAGFTRSDTRRCRSRFVLETDAQSTPENSRQPSLRLRRAGPSVSIVGLEQVDPDDDRALAEPLRRSPARCRADRSASTRSLACGTWPVLSGPCGAGGAQLRRAADQRFFFFLS